MEHEIKRHLFSNFKEDFQLRKSPEGNNKSVWFASGLTSRKPFVVMRYRPDDYFLYQINHDAQKTLFKYGAEVPEVVYECSLADQSRVAVHEFIEKRPGNRRTKEDIINTGAAFGKMHALSNRLSGLPCFYSPSKRKEGLPIGICQTDVAWRNIILAKNRAVLIDFDFAGAETFCRELTAIAIHLLECHDSRNPGEKIAAFMKGYCAHRKLEDIEIEHLYEKFHPYLKGDKSCLTSEPASLPYRHLPIQKLDQKERA